MDSLVPQKPNKWNDAKLNKEKKNGRLGTGAGSRVGAEDDASVVSDAYDRCSHGVRTSHIHTRIFHQNISISWNSSDFESNARNS